MFYTPSFPKELTSMNFLPSFPKESSPSEQLMNPPRVYRGMEIFREGVQQKTVSLIETVLTKNPVVSYCINTIYTLLFVKESKKFAWLNEENKVSIPGNGGWGY